MLKSLPLKVLSKALSAALTAAVLTLSPSIALAAEGTDAATETVQYSPNGYIKDDLFIYMHTGSGKQYRVQGSINAGTPIEVLTVDDETGFAQIKDPKGRTGWIEKINLSDGPSVLSQLQSLQDQYDELAAASQSEQSNTNELARQLDESSTNSQQLTQQITNLKSEKQELQQKLNAHQNLQRQNTMIHGASIAVVGILLGLLMPALVRRRRRSDGWA